jgi:hypothetical protein
MDHVPHVMRHRGKWAIRLDGRGRALALFDTKGDAIDAVRAGWKKYKVHCAFGLIIDSVELPPWIDEDALRKLIRSKLPRKDRPADKKSSTISTSRTPRGTGTAATATNLKPQQ